MSRFRRAGTLPVAAVPCSGSPDDLADQLAHVGWPAFAEAQVPQRVLGYEPHYEGSPIIFGPPGGASGAHGMHTFAARPGHHLPPQVVPESPRSCRNFVARIYRCSFGAVTLVVTLMRPIGRLDANFLHNVLK